MSKSLSEIVKEKEILEDKIEILIDSFLKDNNDIKDLSVSIDFIINGLGHPSRSMVAIEIKL